MSELEVKGKRVESREGGRELATCAVVGEQAVVINQLQAKVANQLMFQQAQKLLQTTLFIYFFFLGLSIIWGMRRAPCLVATCNCQAYTHTHTPGCGVSSHPLQQLNVSKNNVGPCQMFARFVANGLCLPFAFLFFPPRSAFSLLPAPCPPR